MTSGTLEPLSPDDRTTQTPQRRSHQPRPLRASIELGPDAGVEHVAAPGGRIAIGVAAGNELTLSDPTVSRYHLELEATPRGIRVKDLGSLNGTFLGSIAVEAVVVPPGTRIGIGATTVLVDECQDADGDDNSTAVTTPGLVAESGAMRELGKMIAHLAPAQASVLIQGETGTGKEVVARAIHALSPRRDAPFVVVDCGSMPSTLIFSQLFGHERGAFTGADRRHLGAFEQGHGGTVFLDEIGELPLDVQPVLLGVLERRRFRRLSGDRDVEVDVRVVAATHRDLRAAANDGAFRADLYYRLAVARLVIPPLRERPEDVAPLIRHFIEELTGQPAAPPFDAAAIETLSHHHFAGNARELRNIVESALAIGKLTIEPPVGAAVGAPPASATGQAVTDPQVDAELSYRDARAEAVAAFERQWLTALIERSGGNASEAARRAKMDRSYLLSLLKRHGLR